MNNIVASKLFLGKYILCMGSASVAPDKEVSIFLTGLVFAVRSSFLGIERVVGSYHVGYGSRVR